MDNQIFNFISKYMTLTLEEENAIIELNIFRTYKKETVLLREGDFSNEYYFVIKGCLRSYYIVDGDEKITDFYVESELFSPPCVISNTPSDHYISCVEDCVLSVATPRMEQEIFRKFPRFESLCRIVSEEALAENHTTLAEYKNASPEQRYLNFIKNRPGLIQRIPQYQIASYLGITPESLSRIRKRLNENNEAFLKGTSGNRFIAR